MPADTVVDVEEGTAPGVTGEATGYEDWASAYWSNDSTTQVGTTWDSTYYNYQLFRNWKAESDSNGVVNDTTYGHINPIYNRMAQIITVQDTAKPVFTYVYGNQNMDFTEWQGGIPLSEGIDNSGIFQINRTEISTQGSDPDSCNFYNFSVNVKDSIHDPSNNWRVAEFEVNVNLDPHNFYNFPWQSQIEYKEDITTDDTGGLPDASNPTGIEVFVNQNPPMINSTQNPDPTIKEHYWYGFDWNHSANDTICYNSIFQNQHLTVVETNPPFWSYVTNDTIVDEGTNLHANNLGWSVAADTVAPVIPPVTYWDELIEEVPDIYRLWERHWEAEDLSGTNAPDTSSFITEDLTTGVPENPLVEEKDVITVYPNPSAGISNIKFQIQGELPAYVEIYNFLGIKKDEIQILNGQEQIQTNVSSYPSGIYYVVLKNSKVIIANAKLVVYH